MVVFDPLAILLIVAAQTTYYSSKQKINKTYKKLKEKVESSKKVNQKENINFIDPDLDRDDVDDYEEIVEESEEQENTLEVFQVKETKEEENPTNNKKRENKIWGNTSDNTRRH